MNKFFIPGNVPSLKNGKQWTGKFLVYSKTCQNYINKTKSFYQQLAADFIKCCKDKPKPLKVQFKFIRDSRRKFDYSNSLQTVEDLMVKHGWIKDDNADELMPIFDYYEYDKENPGVEITVL